MGLQNGRFFGLVPRQLVVQHHVQQRFVNQDSVAVVDKAKLAEAVHEEAHPGAGRPDHLRQSLLRNFGEILFGLASLADRRHQEEDARQTLFAGVEELVDKISLGSHAARQQEFQE